VFKASVADCNFCNHFSTEISAASTDEKSVALLIS
jgi:hypothetical protein